MINGPPLSFFVTIDANCPPTGRFLAFFAINLSIYYGFLPFHVISANTHANQRNTHVRGVLGVDEAILTSELQGIDAYDRRSDSPLDVG